MVVLVALQHPVDRLLLRVKVVPVEVLLEVPLIIMVAGEVALVRLEHKVLIAQAQEEMV